MKKRIVVWFLLVSMLALTACESEQQVNQIVRDYVKKEYGVGVTIEEREDVNEGNGGDRTFVLKSKEEIPVTFEVYLKGLFSTSVTGDTYKKQKKQAISGRKFFNKNKKELSTLGFSDVEFSDREGIQVTASYDKDINLYDEKSVNTIYQFIQLFNTYKPAPETLSLKTKSIEVPVEFKGLSRFREKGIVKRMLFQDLHVVNVSLFQRDFDKFKAIEEGVERRGYSLEFGLTVGVFDQSFYCFEENLLAHECTGGYLIGLKGGKTDKESLFDLVRFLKSQPIRISNIAFHDHGIYLEKLDQINHPDQIVIDPD
ncbi:hypothetical protein [Neobacillus drentensis]|uniref:hypothetical protein n=1 Tax=Neobacillus drentensis TaxID=220684 RepID=UPI0030005273